MKIALLYNINQKNAWYEADFDTPDTITVLKNSLNQFGDTFLMEVTRMNYPEILSQLIEGKFDLVFNVTEGYPGESREAVWPILLEQFQIQYTGPRPKNLTVTLDKSLTKRLLQQNLREFMTDEFRILSKNQIEINLLEKICSELNFPMFVKFNSEGSSLGIDNGSIVANKNELFSKLLQLRGGFPFADILVEEYVDGIDISTTFIEGMGIFGPVEYAYSNNSAIYNYNMKIYDYNSVVDVKNFSSIRSQKLLDLSKEIVTLLGLEGYARLEFRISKDTIKFIEVNNQVCFMPENAFMQAVLMNNGLKFGDIVGHVVKYRVENPIPYPFI